MGRHNTPRKKPAMLKLKFLSALNPRLTPLLVGTVKSENIELQFILSPPSELFYHNLRHDDFDVSEMSMSECLIVKERNESGKWKWAGLPVFMSKAFMWFSLSVNTNSGIQRGEDFKGKRVAIPDYPMTAALWMRIMFKELHGVRPQDIRGFESSFLMADDKSSPTSIKEQAYSLLITSSWSSKEYSTNTLG